MKDKDNFLRRYLEQAPVFLAMERARECRLISEIELKRPILDLGCGDGLFSSILFTQPPELGMDISFREIISSLKRKAYINTIRGELSKLPLKSRRINTIICNSVMEHVLDLKAALKEAYRILAPAGKFVITIPTDNYEKFLFYPRLFSGLGLKILATSYRKAVNRIFKHYHAYSPPQWLKLMEDAGFKIVKIIPYCPREVLGLSDFYLPFSFVSRLNKKIFRRWILWPEVRRMVVKFLEPSLRKRYLAQDIKEGACILIEAIRV